MSKKENNINNNRNKILIEQNIYKKYNSNFMMKIINLLKKVKEVIKI